MTRGPVAGGAYAVLLALALSGCGHSATPASDLVRTPGRHAPRPPTPLMAVQDALPLTPEQEVARVGLRSLEIPADQRVRWPGPGRSQRGALAEVCATAATNDRHTVARRTVTGTVPHSGVWFTDQVTAFDSEASARLALRQVRRAVVACATPRVRVTPHPATLPVVRSYVLRLRVARSSDTRAALVAQQRGDVLDVLTVTAPRALTPRQERLLLREAGDTGRRLARLPLASTGT